MRHTPHEQKKVTPQVSTLSMLDIAWSWKCPNSYAETKRGSSNVPWNMDEMKTCHVCTRNSASVPRVLCVRRDVLSSTRNLLHAQGLISIPADLPLPTLARQANCRQTKLKKYWCRATLIPMPSHGRSAPLKQREISQSVLQRLRRKRRQTLDEPWIHQEPCDEGCEPWWILRSLQCQAALQTVLSVASKNVKGYNVKTSTIRLFSQQKTSNFSPVQSRSTVVNVHNNALPDQIL